jgi:hypothetical protein
MILETSMSNFIGDISLGETRKGRIISAHNTVRDWLESHESISSRNPYTFLQGSYASHTSVRPQNDGSFDVDVLIAMDLDDIAEQGGDAIDIITKALEDHGTYKDKIEIKNHCVRLNYANEFHLDITPGNRTDGNDAPFEIANDWHISDPKGLIEYCRQKQKDTNGYFYPVVKMLKWWRNLRYGDEGSPKSIILIALVGQYIPTSAETYEEAFIATLDGIVGLCKDQLNPPEITNPAIDEKKHGQEVISKSWSTTSFLDFKEKITAALSTAKAALKNGDEEETISLWNSDDLFMDTFPKTLNGVAVEEKVMANLWKDGKVGILANLGSVTTTVASAKKIPHYPAYGQDESL